jgi:acetyl-CoA C-acetyltransferase
MGVHAESTARKGAVSRERQDEFAAESHRKAVAAQQRGKFDAEIVPVEVPGRKGATVVEADEGPRRDTTAESLAGLKPAFGAKGATQLTVTAGNASSLNDGAAAVVVTSAAYAKEQGLPVLARIAAYATGAVEPQDLFFDPRGGKPHGAGRYVDR